MERYSPQKIEKKWQKYWEKSETYKNYGKDKKFYALDMFPYPSGAGLHVGHPKGYIATDVVSRFKMLSGYSVLHPMGWDAFGLPAENYAIKNKVHPKIAVAENIATFKKQLELFGFTYDWDREINTTDPEYYRWTQWIFLQMFEKGLAYESEEPVNWCSRCKTVLANEDLENGRCERCGSEIIQRKLRQWVLRMTKYADRLLYDLDDADLDWEELIKEQQRNWIGRSEGAQFEMKIKNSDEKIEVYTTRLDTVLGMTYAVVAPEHEIIGKLKDKIENYGEVEKYIIRSQSKTELERTELQKEKSGVEIEGIKIINPFNGEEIPLYVADYVLGFYGTGAVMAVPAHDQRDLEFANKYSLEKKIVIIKRKGDDFPQDLSYSKLNEEEKAAHGIAEIEKMLKDGKAFEEEGMLVNSGRLYNYLSSKKSREKLTERLEKEKIGKKKVNYKMRDWVFSRQRYWGEPIPIVHCEKCGAVAVPEKDLPVRLPEVESYEPTDTGESPLAKISDWVNTKCPKCGGPGKRETNTMPQWAGSCWYYLRYIDNKNDKALVDKKKEKEWMPVDLYVGGAEHATRHLLYARFWHKFLYDIGAVSTEEPFKKLVHVGLIQAEDGRKMSKRWNNVTNPDDVIEKFGADAMRVYEMFMGPFTQNIAWSTNGVTGAYKFLEKTWNYFESWKQDYKDDVEANEENIKIYNKSGDEGPDFRVSNVLHKTIKKVTEDIENFRFNTAISQMMIFINYIRKESKESLTQVEEINLTIPQLEKFLILLSPFAPHIAEEIWQEKLGHKESIFKESWPEYDPELARDEKIELVIQVNGKVRDKIMASADIEEVEAKRMATESEKARMFIAGKEIKKIIYIKGKLISIVV